MTDNRSGPDRSDESTRLPDADVTIVSPSETSGKGRIGPYRILQQVGEGGMGQVYEAEQEKPIRRRVALKIIKAGMDSKQVVARFEAERQALAMMDHPAIAKVFDAGITPQGQPYFAMEFIQGTPITEYCDRQRLTTEERLGLFRQVCEGVQHAHQKAVIHRDLKPSNVLVVTQDGKRLPKVIDFGVAKATTQKLTESTLFTELGVLIGTPEYMSPEQAEMTGENVDTRTDVYSLGVMLYELLVGALPFDSKELREAGFDGIRRKIREEAPSRPSTRVTTLGGSGSEESARLRQTSLPALKKQLQGDLDWITMKALEKDRMRRYGSPAELSADIDRYLTSKPIEARPPSTVYQLGKFVGRNRILVGGALATMVVLVVGIVGTTFGMVRAQQQREIAEAERADAQIEAERARAVADFLKYGFGFVSPRKDAGAELTVREMLGRAAEDIPYIFEGRPTAEASVRAMLGDTMYDLAEFADSAEQFDLAAELMEAEIAKPDSSDLWEVFLLVTLHDRQNVERNLGGDGGEKMLALYRRIYAGGLRLARDRAPEFVEPLERMVAMTRDQEAPDREEWLAILDDISRIHSELGPSANPRGVAAAAIIVGVAKTQLSNLLEFHYDGNASWKLVVELLRDSPYAKPRDQAMLLWLLIWDAVETPERSLELSLELQGISARLYPPTHPRRARDQIVHGDVLRRLGRYQEAEEIMLPAYAIVVAARGSTGGNVPFYASRIMLLYDDWGQEEKLAEFLARVELSGDSTSVAWFLHEKSKAETTGG